MGVVEKFIYNAVNKFPTSYNIFALWFHSTFDFKQILILFEIDFTVTSRCKTESLYYEMKYSLIYFNGLETRPIYALLSLGCIWHRNNVSATQMSYVQVIQRVPINLVHGEIADYLKSQSD